MSVDSEYTGEEYLVNRSRKKDLISCFIERGEREVGGQI
jgi:hypothetical protein